MRTATKEGAIIARVAGIQAAALPAARGTGIAARPRRARWRRALLHAPPSVWATFDLLLVAAATALSYRTMVVGDPAYGWVVGVWANMLACCGGIALAGLVFGLYERPTLTARSRIVVRSLASLGAGLVLAYAFIHLFLYGATTRWLGLSVAVAYVIVAIPARLLAHHVITTLRANVLCLGSGESIRKMARLVQQGSRGHYRIVGHLTVPGATDSPPSAATETHDADDEAFIHDCPRLGNIDDLERVLRNYDIDEVIVDATLASHPAIADAVLTGLEHRCRITDHATFAEKLLDEVPLEGVNAQWFLAADVQSSAGYDAIKRVIDVSVALLGLILSLPLLLLIALLVRLDSRGPAIYRQARVGLRGRVFNIYKFRTMRADAERGGARWAQENDNRVTRIGRLLRKTRLDELPQLWNVLRGEMSLVGPRPERPQFVEMLSRLLPHYRQRHLIRPGLTGWAQIRYGYGASIEDARRKLCYDLYYLKHRSIDLDAAIMIRTLGRFLIGSR